MNAGVDATERQKTKQLENAKADVMRCNATRQLALRVGEGTDGWTMGVNRREEGREEERDGRREGYYRTATEALRLDTWAALRRARSFG